MVNDDGIGIGNIQPAFDDRCGYQHIVFTFHKAHHGIFEFVAAHLSMRHDHFHTRNTVFYHGGHIMDILHAVVDEKHLPAAVYFVLNGACDDIAVENLQFSMHRLPVGRRRIDDAEIACTHERKMQGAWNWRCSECKGVYIHPQLLEFLLAAYTELLFFIDHEQAQILEFYVFGEQTVRPDQDIYFPFFYPFQGFFLFTRRFETVEVVDRHRKTA